MIRTLQYIIWLNSRWDQLLLLFGHS